MTANSFTARIINILLTAAGFVATCLALHAVLPLPEIEQLTPKLRFFLSHRDEFNTLFVGSSRLYHGVSPAVFDDAMAASGFPTRSFNCALDGSTPPERLYLIERLLSAHPRNLKWLFVEFTGITLSATGDQLRSRREVEWHDWPRSWLMVRKALSTGGRRRELKLKELRDLLVLHLQLFGRRFTNMGRGWELGTLFHRPGADGRSDAALGPRGDGYLPATAPMNEKQIATYKERLARELAQPPRRLSDPVAEHAYWRTARAIRKSGAVPILVVSPVISQVPLIFTGADGAPGPAMAFNDMKTYPNFYEIGSRADYDHLNDRGAKEFSRVLAERFSAELRVGTIQ